MEDQNKNILHNQEDVNPTTQLDQIINDTDKENIPDTNGTGANRAVPTSGTVIVKEGDEKEARIVENNPVKPSDIED